MKGHIRRRGKNSWGVVLSWREGGRFKQKAFTAHGPKREAQALLAQKLTEFNAGVLARAPANLTVAQYLDRWLKEFVRVRPTTYASYEGIVRCHIVPEIGNVPLVKLRPARLQAFYRKLEDKPRADGKAGRLSATTVRYTYSVLNIALRRAVRLTLIPRNPVDATDPPLAEKTEQRTFTEDEARRFLRSVEGDRFSALYWLALALGLRRGELLGLRWQDLDLAKGLLHVRQSLVALHGRPVVQQPKTERGRRTVELTPELVAVIQRYRAQQAKAKLFFGQEYKDHGLVFPTERGEPMAPRSLTRQFERRLASAGLPRIRFHDLRHTFASLAFPDADLKTVSSILGHGDISTTADIYSHVLHGHQRRTVRKVLKQVSPRS